MLLLKNLKIENFLSHQSSEISFKENDKLLLTGKSGSGKSTIVDSVLWVLYNKGRSDNRNLIRRGSKSATVSLKLVDGERETLITRSVNDKGKNTLTVTQNTGSKGQFLLIERTGLKDIQDWIENTLLKASYTLFINSIAYPQENNESFVKASAAKRKDLLLEIVRAGNFDELYEKTRKLITANEKTTAVDLSKIENLESNIKNSKEIANKVEQYKKEVKDTSTKLEVLTEGEKTVEKKINDISSIVRDIENKETLKLSILGSLSDIEKQIKEGDKTIEEHNSLDIESYKKDVQKADGLLLEVENIEKEIKESIDSQQKINAHLANKPHVTDYTKDIESINKRLIPLITDSGKCPSGDDCPFVVPIKGQIDFLSEQIIEKTEKGEEEEKALSQWSNEYAELVPTKDTTELYDKLKEIKDKIKVLDTSREIVNKWMSFSETLVRIEEKSKELKEKELSQQGNLTDIEMQIKGLEKEREGTDINKLNTELSSLRIEKQDLQKIRDEAVSNSTLAINAQETIKNATTELVCLQNGIKKGQEDNESLALLKEALSPRGIKAVVIDYILPSLEERINDILGQLSDFRIRLDTQQPKISDEGIKEGLFITIVNDCGEEMSYENYSGGEKNRITISIYEGLASLTSITGFRIFDEMIVGLNNEMVSDFIEILLKLQEKYSQIICISHIPEVKDVFSDQIMVTKINGISKIS